MVFRDTDNKATIMNALSAKQKILLDQFIEATHTKSAKTLKEYYKKRYKIFEPIKEWCDKHYYADMIVTIEADESITTTILYCERLNDGEFDFLDDWDEGQSSIKLCGFMPLDNIRIWHPGKKVDDECVMNIDFFGGNWYDRSSGRQN